MYRYHFVGLLISSVGYAPLCGANPPYLLADETQPLKALLG
jgi:hypothetical protein